MTKVICPKAKECLDLGCPEAFPHEYAYCHLKRIGETCPACIPLPDKEIKK